MTPQETTIHQAFQQLPPDQAEAARDVLVLNCYQAIDALQATARMATGEEAGMLSIQVLSEQFLQVREPIENINHVFKGIFAMGVLRELTHQLTGEGLAADVAAEREAENPDA